jgi:Tfp pilus assembly protein PilV
MPLVIASVGARRRQRGISLLESLVSFVILAASTVAIGQLQSQLRLASDVARERSEAVRLGTEAMEDLRSFAVVAAASAPRSYDAIVDATTTIDAAVSAGHASYRVARHIDDASVAGAKMASVSVRWNDRDGIAREVSLHSFVAGVAPAYGGALGLDAGAIASASRGVLGRAPTIPVQAHNLGNGRSAWKPLESGTLALVFDNASGAIVGRCDGLAGSIRTRDLSLADLAACASGHWLLVAGTVRFAAAASLGVSTAAPAATVAIALGDGSYPAPATCFSAAQKTVRYVAAGSLHLDAVGADATPASAGLAAWDDTGERFVAWHCVVVPRADGRWSGRATVVAGGWTIGTGGNDRRVCRYAGGNGDAIDANIAHPGEYANIDRALVAQNFLVVPGSESCPRDPATEQHQP